MWQSLPRFPRWLYFPGSLPEKLIRPLEKNAEREQNAFIAAASHELRSPLTVIQTSLSAVSYADPEQTEHFISISLDECKRMSRLVQDMLSLSRSDNHTWVLDCTSCEIDTLLLDVYEKSMNRLPGIKKNAAYSLSCLEDSLPVCFCDSLKNFLRSLAILIDNALAFSSSSFTVST